MTLARELVKTTGVYLLVLLRAYGCCPMPVAVIFGLCVFQCSQLLASVADYVATLPARELLASVADYVATLPAKAAQAWERLNVATLPTKAWERLTVCKTSFFATCLGHLVFWNIMWMVLATVVKQLVQVTGLAHYPVLVPIMAGSIGMIGRYASSMAFAPRALASFA